MPKRLELEGKVFGNLTVVRFVAIRQHNDNRNTMWECSCVCGNITLVVGANLSSGHTKSCGCTVGEFHGKTNTRLYNIWKGMRNRCNNTNEYAYKYYGERGIKVCTRWDKYSNFYADMSPKYIPGLTIERRDNNNGYSPENCYWATMDEQANNRSNNRIILFDGKQYTLSQASKVFNISRRVIESRLDRYRWSVEKTLTTPAKHVTARIFTINGKNYKLSQVCKLYGADVKLVKQRLRYNWTIEDALTQPKQLRSYENNLPK